MRYLNLDSKDLAILDVVQMDAGITLKMIAQKIECSYSRTHFRITSLEEAGYIKGYVSVLNKRKLGMDTIVYMKIRLKDKSKRSREQFESNAACYLEICEIVSVVGNFDYVLKVIVDEINTFYRFLRELKHEVSNISHCESCFVLSEIKGGTQLPLKDVYI